MCLAVPARVIERLEGDLARVDMGGVGQTVSVALVPEVRPGDYVIVHVGYALSRLDEEEAAKTLALFARMAALAADGAGP